MSHDIAGFRAEDKEFNKQIASLNRSAGNNLARVIYEVLGAEDLDCGCSGCGDNREFTLGQLRAALENVPSGDDCAPEREFLTDCIEKGGDGGVLIGFW